MHTHFEGRLSAQSEQIELEQLDSHSFSEDLLASGQSSTSYADLCCGESDILHDRQLFSSLTEHSCAAKETVAKAQMQRTYSTPATHAMMPEYGEGQQYVAAMVRYVIHNSIECHIPVAHTEFARLLLLVTLSAHFAGICM